MEVFVRNEDIKYAVVDKSDFEPYSFLLESYDKIEVKSIEQHDAEVKKQVVEELREWLVEDRYNFNMITIRDLKQKLAELERK